MHARLRDDVSLQGAAEQMPVIIRRRVAQWPDESAERTIHVRPLMEQFVGQHRERLFVLFGAVAPVLLIACGNVSNLLLARSTSRGRELAVRSALGAGQGRLVRQLLTESLVLGIVSAAARVGLAYWLIGVLVASGPADVPRLEQARLDGIVLTFAILTAVAASVIFGLVWPGEDAIGRRLTSAHPEGPTTVVGIAADVRLGGPSEPAPPTFYVPIAQLNDEAWGWARGLFVVARAEGNAAALGPSVRRVIGGIDPGIPLYGTFTMEERMAATTELARFNTMLLTLLGGAGLLLAAVGIYGVIAYFAAQRTSEIGIRMALGADRADVVRLVVRQAAVPVLAGVALGALGAMFATHERRPERKRPPFVSVIRARQATGGPAGASRQARSQPPALLEMLLH